jgi:hypothetical protein
LTARKSIERKIGPVCYRKTGGTYQGDFVMDMTDDMYDLEWDPDMMDIVFKLDENMVAHFNIRQEIIKHSPTGMAWGYAGSGPSDFAINILAKFTTRKNALNPNLYHEFKFQFLAGFGPGGGIIPGETIKDWTRARIKALGGKISYPGQDILTVDIPTLF